MSNTRFSLGQLLITARALARLDELGVSPAPFFARHQAGDWGDIPPDDAAANEEALAEGGRLLSVYPAAEGCRVWIITEADRRLTTMLLPEEY
ncbi:hypothetical protein [Alkalilimnicola sp. S0819]|uniref:hypothetical protein n=1 Tax=Alkalilimnicola sp. S0819 TaxID=2613922 RepID=UPI0012616EAE|nr:hypothetical protein [Alkalilimnicola sp. S0819]KAB7623402.1 hypothetical protein F3N43_09905 [Alkalilimnicola sp. S0819]MPQ16948.1 hypothetical protein [Alkalilimnicola sp. S0819]